ncbi:sugar phosphate isomerase/epimerase [Leptospira sp. FAT2]|uniref:sugar phosphate isomerase/epimerase family protein n=1 Tax=Leptospira sanjuanensis TaxID=2879643 RepID=UPI001EE8535D|nr:TIM barrel protein [Leptospira sanjuanensis]MCG6167600.1 sugar phosphate isomerase/epimerase [Leptospira sanjuanensis]MCG6193019.1 sugar phosphate isomerase/epimerase [Leptospira sanjuanensis]
MIYISTGGFYHQNAFEISKLLIENGFLNIELSGGQFDTDLIPNLLSLKEQANFQVHNYFPPYKIPFVFNLASLDPDISAKSFQHVKECITLSRDFNRKVYSFHAGYLLDPDPRELGKRIKARKVNSRADATDVFLSKIHELSKFASDMGIRLLIENNVLSKNNFEEFKLNPLLMVDPNETKKILDSCPKNVGLLVDVAHLKVSAESLSFDPEDMFRECDRYIEAYHLSDNDGKSDSNDLIHEDSWFWPFLKKNLNYYSLEIYNKPLKKLRECEALTLRKLKY